MRSAEELTAMMPSHGGGDGGIQLRQTRFRQVLVEDWQIPEGARVLEIGCGQGDASLVLADAVGEHGRVLCVDLAEPTYGAPLTVGQSTRHLKEGPFGDRFEFRFQFDALNSANAFKADEFDFVVLAHCTWYFQNLDALKRTLTQIRPWAKTLCLSEWDLEPQSIDQLGHFLSVLIQGQVEAYKADGRANVRTPYSRETLHRLLKEADWQVASERLLDASELDDGRWEIGGCLAATPNELESLEIPPKGREFLRSQLDVLKRLSGSSKKLPLPAYSVVARRT